MDLVVRCSIDNMNNSSCVDIDWVIKNIRYRKAINTCSIIDLFYKKFYGKSLYLRSIQELKYIKG